MAIEDDIEFRNSNIRMDLNKVFTILKNDETIKDWDLVYLGHSIRKKNLEMYDNIYGQQKEITIIKHLINITVGGTFAYIINKSGAKKLVDYVQKNGIRHGIDYLMFAMAKDMNLYHYETAPRLILSDYVDASATVDSDIQYSYDALF
jgi:GR25 family glycosyltransferase involved in LPS biosynthesis